MPTRNPNLDNLSNEGVGLLRDERDGWSLNLGLSKIDLSVPRSDEWWTGLAPAQCPGFQGGVLRALPMPDLAVCSRQEVSDYFNNGWTLTELLFSGLASDEAFYRPPYHGLRHPLIFYYVHPACLYINKFRVAGLIDTPINSLFETLFETGVDEMSWDDMSKNEIVWPLIDQAHDYRRRVYQLVKGLIDEHPGLADGHAPITDKDPLWALFMGFEHERIHLETSSVLMRELPLSLLSRPAYFPADAVSVSSSQVENSGHNSLSPAASEYVAVGAGRVRIGKDRNFPTYGWDNEYGCREVDVEAFETTATLITNAQFLEFVSQGGYSDNANWTADGLRWRQYRNVKWPTFWVLDGPQGLHRYKLRTIFDTVDLPLDWPCVVNYHEAKAYCNWLAGKENRPGSLRLLTEAEHYLLRQGREFLAEQANLSLSHGSERAVSAGPGDIKDLFGNVWQWLEDDFHPLPGFRVHPYYDDFSTPCFDGEHKMIVGGSFISAGDEASVHERFHFRPHFFQHAGFRMVRTSPVNRGQAVTIKKDVLGRPLPVASELLGLSAAETALEAGLARKRAVDLRVLAEFGYLLDDPSSNDFASTLLRQTEAVARVVARTVRAHGRDLHTALDVGASLGAVSYELASELKLDSVVAVELREPLYERAVAIQKDARLDFEIFHGSNISRRVEQALDGVALDKVTFKRADPTSLPAEFQNFDLVVLNDIITQVPSPAALLGRLSGERGLVAPSGLLLVLSDFIWGAACDESLWLGGKLDEAGLLINSADEIERELSQFELLEKLTLPYLELQGSGRAMVGEKTLLVFRRR